MSLALLTFVGVFLLILSGGLLLFYREAVLSRLSSVVVPRTAAAGGLLQRLLGVEVASVQKVVDPFQKILPRSPEEVSVIQKRLILAGYRKDAYLNIFYGAKVLVPLSLVVLVTVMQLYEYGAFVAYGLSLALGFLLPDFWLGHKIKSRQFEIQLGLPEALDLMVVCVEAGLGLDQAILRVADELKLSRPEIADELNLVNLEQRAGRARAEALKNLAARTDVDSVRAFTSTLIQADQFGTSVAKTLRAYSDGLRTLRRQQVEEQAAKTTVKLVFPLVFFIFPSLFLVTLGPALIVMFEGFKKFFFS